MNAQTIIDGKKLCSQCGIIKPISDFSPDGRTSSGWKSHCKVCHAKSNRKFRDTQKNIQESPIIDGRKWCPRCRRFVSCDNFRPNPWVPTGLVMYCNDCVSNQRRIKWAEMQERQCTYDHRPMRVAQGGRCALCATTGLMKYCYLDYSVSGKVCGLICADCLAMLHIYNDPKNLEAVRKYEEVQV